MTTCSVGVTIDTNMMRYEELASILRMRPDDGSHNEGDPRVLQKNVYGPTWDRSRLWLDSRVVETASPEEHIEELLARLPTDKPRWKRLPPDAVLQMRVAVYMSRLSAEFGIRPATLARVSALGMTIWVSCYVCRQDEADDD